MSSPAYLQQDSTQTLREGIAEYYAFNEGLLDPDALPPGCEELFRQHDAGHVVFGCDTSYRGETRIDTWTVMATTAGLRGLMEYFKYPQVNQIFDDVGRFTIMMESCKAVPDIWRVFRRSRRMTAKWPWDRFEKYLDRPLKDLREEFNIQVIAS